MASGVGCYQTIPAALNCLSGLTTLEPLRRGGRDLTLKNRQLCYPACQVTMTGDGWRLGSHASEDMTALHVHSLHALAYCERLFYLEEVLRVADERVYAGPWLMSQ